MADLLNVPQAGHVPIGLMSALNDEFSKNRAPIEGQWPIVSSIVQCIVHNTRARVEKLDIPNECKVISPFILGQKKDRQTQRPQRADTKAAK